ncbi:hypothetical protein C8R46DRAFT_1341842 [Mycena filopes]|nr:hypothetical protein C8R46DRAFT_1341842 [Mycena filopes]
MSGRGTAKPRQGHMGGPKRRCRCPVHMPVIEGVTKPAVRRMARRGGVKRISNIMYEETRGALKIFLEGLVRDSIIYNGHDYRKTLTASDIAHALKRSRSLTLYGLGA